MAELESTSSDASTFPSSSLTFSSTSPLHSVPSDAAASSSSSSSSSPSSSFSSFATAFPAVPTSPPESRRHRIVHSSLSSILGLVRVNTWFILFCLMVPAFFTGITFGVIPHGDPLLPLFSRRGAWPTVFFIVPVGYTAMSYLNLALYRGAVGLYPKPFHLSLALFALVIVNTFVMEMLFSMLAVLFEDFFPMIGLVFWIITYFITFTGVFIYEVCWKNEIRNELIGHIRQQRRLKRQQRRQQQQAGIEQLVEEISNQEERRVAEEKAEARENPSSMTEGNPEAVSQRTTQKEERDGDEDGSSFPSFSSSDSDLDSDLEWFEDEAGEILYLTRIRQRHSQEPTNPTQTDEQNSSEKGKEKSDDKAETKQVNEGQEECSASEFEDVELDSMSSTQDEDEDEQDEDLVEEESDTIIELQKQLQNQREEKMDGMKPKHKEKEKEDTIQKPIKQNERKPNNLTYTPRRKVIEMEEEQIDARMKKEEACLHEEEEYDDEEESESEKEHDLRLAEKEMNVHSKPRKQTRGEEEGEEKGTVGATKRNGRSKKKKRKKSRSDGLRGIMRKHMALFFQYIKVIFSLFLYYLILIAYIIAFREVSGAWQPVLVVILELLAFGFRKALLSLTDPFPLEMAMLIAGFWVENITDLFQTLAYPSVFAYYVFAVILLVTFAGNTANLIFLTQWWFTFRVWIKGVLSGRCRKGKEMPKQNDLVIPDDRGHGWNRPGYVRRQIRFYQWKIFSQLCSALFYIYISTFLRFGRNAQYYVFSDDPYASDSGEDEVSLSEDHWQKSVIYAAINVPIILLAGLVGFLLVRYKHKEAYKQIKSSLATTLTNKTYIGMVVAILSQNAVWALFIIQFHQQVWWAFLNGVEDIGP